jgi:hypothetical protein
VRGIGYQLLVIGFNSFQYFSSSATKNR